MLKREMRINLKNFIVWTCILISIFLVVFLVYPSIMKSDSITSINEIMKIFPQEMLKAFNMDISSLDTVYGWIKSEGFIFVLLVTSSYAAILGSNILLKEENDKTIEYLNSLPITRKKIVGTKITCGLIYTISMVVIIGIFNFIGLALSGSFDKQTFILLSLTPIFSSIVIFSLCMFLSTFTHKTKKMLGISLGIVFLSYFLNILSGLGKSTEFLKYISILTLADTRNVIINSTINPWIILISLILSISLFLFTIIRYDRKELI